MHSLRNHSTSTRLLLAAIALCVAGCRDLSHVLALVLAVKGGVAQVEPTAKSLAAGTKIVPPSTIRTEADSAMVISALPGVMVRLEAGGEIEIEQLKLDKHMDEMISRTAHLQLRRGRAIVWVDEFRQGSIEVRVRTSGGDFIFRGAALAEITLGAGGETRAICVSGALSADGTALSLGQWTTVLPGSGRPAAQFAADNDEVWKALLRAREIEPQMLDLQTRQREHTPVRGLNSTEMAPKN